LTGTLVPMAAITLRPARDDDLETLAMWRADPWFLSEFDDFGFRSLSSLRTDYAENGLLTDDGGLLLVTLDDGTASEGGGTAIGDVTWRAVPWGPNGPSVAWDIGIGLTPDYRGMGYGTEAQRILVDYLFGTTSANRVQASVDTENKAEVRCLEKLGFTQEGVVRGAQFRAGAWRDVYLFSRLRSD
jgi:RimJ/RimL family protein N-acetyltransferase